MRALFTIAFLMSLMVHVPGSGLIASPHNAAPSSRPMIVAEDAFDNPPVIELMAINPVSIQITVTDMSEEESLYEIYRSRAGLPAEFVRSFAAPQSGGFYILLDYPQPMVFNAVWTYTINATVNGTVYPGVASETVNTANYNPMTYPTFDSWVGAPTTETSIAFAFRNPVEGALTEIYRAPTHEGPFEIIATRSEAAGKFIDTGLSPGTNYFYTLRGTLNGQVSAFAGITQMSTHLDFKTPDFTAEARSDGSVHITLHDHGLSDVRYELIREGGGTGEIIKTFVLPDSGTVVNYVDDYVLPDITYVYILDVFFEGGGGATVGLDTATTFANEPDLGYLYLIDPFSDTEMGYYVTDDFTLELPDVNIAVQANELTSSVVFYFEGSRSVDNAPPFAVLPDVDGDFKSLRLTNGLLTLIAIAYPEQNGGGLATDTVTVTFRVEILDCTFDCFKLVDANTDTELQSIEEGEIFIKPVDSYFNIRFIPASNPGSVEFRIEDNIYRVENAAPFSLAGDRNGDYLPWKAGLSGIYTIRATPYSGPNRTGTRGETVTIYFSIVQPEITEPRFTIVNADTDEDIQRLNDGDVFVKPAGLNINVRYNVPDYPGGESVVFRHQGKVVRTENAAPFTIRGDYNGNYLAWTGAVPGNHRIDATAYELDRGQGEVRITSGVNFTIVEEDGARIAGETNIEIYPNPAPMGQTEFMISGGQRTSPTAIEIISITGEVVYSQVGDCEGDCDVYAVKIQEHLIPGVYLVRIRNNENSTLRRLLVK